MRLGAIALLSGAALIFAVPASWSQPAEQDTEQTNQPEAAPPVPESDAADSAALADGSILLELNGAAATEDNGCRLTVVTTNRLDQDLGRAAWQVAIFDGDGVVKSLPILDFGAMVTGKTKVAMFELPDQQCTDIGRIVVNDVAACTTDDGEDLREACLGGLATQSRTDIDFGL